MMHKKRLAVASALSIALMTTPLFAQVGNVGTSGGSVTQTPGVQNGQAGVPTNPSSNGGSSVTGRTSQSGLQPSTQPTREPQSTGTISKAQRNTTSAQKKTDDQHK